MALIWNIKSHREQVFCVIILFSHWHLSLLHYVLIVWHIIFFILVMHLNLHYALTMAIVTTACQDQLTHQCSLIMVCTVCSSVTKFWVQYPEMCKLVVMDKSRAYLGSFRVYAGLVSKMGLFYTNPLTIITDISIANWTYTIPLSLWFLFHLWIFFTFLFFWTSFIFHMPRHIGVSAGTLLYVYVR